MESEILFRLLLYFVLLIFSGFFSGSETALFSLSQVQLMQLADDKRPRAQLVHNLLSNPRRLIATIFIGNEFVNIGASSLMASVTSFYFAEQGRLAVSILSTAISVTLILFLGEITPKNLAVRLERKWALLAGRPLWLLAALMAPLRILIEKIADLVVLIVARRIEPVKAAVGEDEFLSMVDAVMKEGEIDRSEHRMIHNIFKFGDRRVSEVMTSAKDVFALSDNLPIHRIIEEVRRGRYSRIPIYHNSRNQVVGLLFLKDLLPVAYHLNSEHRRLRDLIHPAYFIPKSTKCSQLFREFQRQRTHLALVVDEYGKLVGLVTMEDLLEEMFGEIKDEKEITSHSGKPDEGGPIKEDGSDHIDQ